MKKLVFCFFAFSLILPSCVKETEEKPVDIKPGKQLLVSNEGNYQSGNASLTLYHLDSSYLVSPDIFNYVNQRPAGDVLQSITRINNLVCLVVNNSGKIEFLDQTFKSVNAITGLRSPRYICQAGNGSSRALVSDIYDDSVAVVELAPAYRVIKKIFIKGWTEQMVYLDGYFYITNPQASSLYVVDGSSFEVKDSIPVGFGSFYAAADYKGKIWIGTKGDEKRNIPSRVQCIDPLTRQVLVSKDASSKPIQCMAMDEDGKTIYVVNDHVYRFSADQQPDFSNPWYRSQGNNFYGIYSSSGKVFLADAIDYNQDGTVFILDDNAGLLRQFKAGKIPNGFLIVN